MDDREPVLDARLKAALRHAPDHEVAPPPGLSQRILDEARRAVEPAARESWWAWITKPAGAAAFAGVALATTIGILWRDGPPPEADIQSRREAPAAAAPAPAPALQAAGSARTEPAPAPAPALDAVATKRSPAPAAKARADPAPAVRAAPPPPPAPAMPAAAVPPAPEPAAQATTRAESATGSTLQRQRSAPARVDGGAAAPAAALAGKLAAGESRIVADPLLPALSATSPGSPSRMLLAELQRQAQGRWQAAAPFAPAAGTALQDAQGRTLGRLRLDDDAALWQPTDEPGRTWRAPLPASALQSLRELLDRVPPRTGE